MSENKTPETETVSSTSEESTAPYDSKPYWDARSKRLEDKAADLCKKIFASLRAAEISAVVLSFDGSGDSGQIDSIDAVDENDESDERQSTKDALASPFEDCPRTLSGFDAEKGEWITRTRPATLRDLIEELGYVKLDTHLPGWVNNEGASGRITIDKEGTIIVEPKVPIIMYESYRFVSKFDGETLKEVDSE